MNKIIICILFIVMFSTVACGSSTNTLENAARNSTQTAEGSVEDQVAAQVAKQLANQQDATVIPNVEPEQKTNFDIEMSDGPIIVQTHQQVDVIFMVANHNETSAISNSQYTATIYDDSSSVLDTQSGYIELILPNENLPIISNMYLQEGQKATKVDVQLISGSIETTDLRPPLFMAEQISYVPDENFPKVTSIMKNMLSRSFSDLKVVAVAYDNQNKIIGGGYTFLSFLPGDGQIGVDIPINVNGTPNAVNLIGTISSLSMLTSDNSQNQSIELIEYGWSQTKQTVSIGFTVKNNNTSQLIDGSQYQVTAYNDTGVVLGTSNGYINNIFPNETTGCSASIYLPEATNVSKVDVQINPGSPSTFILTNNPFLIENINFMADPYFPKVTGIVKNSYKDKITTVKVTVIGYDQDNRIIVSGFTFVDFIPGNGQNAFEVSLDSDKTPVKIMVYTEVTSLSQIGE